MRLSAASGPTARWPAAPARTRPYQLMLPRASAPGGAQAIRHAGYIPAAIQAETRGAAAWRWTTRPSRSCSTSETCRPTGTTSSRTCEPAAPAPAPRDRPAARPGRPRSPVPDGDHHAGGLAGAPHRDPRPGPGHLPALAPDADVPGAPPRASPRYPGPHLLQVRGRL